MINSSRRETRSASREDRAGFAGWSHLYYPANLADIVDPVHPAMLYEYITSRRLSCNFLVGRVYLPNGGLEL
ncbi:MAG TPA: hypothetical protein VFU89_08165 [Rhabdochlamydiaceae bacterium]|nr:hypothetical protein [Rhabdochlamydiaceae bacterium]